MRGIWRLAVNDLRLTARDRPAFIWLLVLPLAMMWFFGGMGAGEGEVPKISLDVVDRDQSWLSRALIEELEQPTVTLRVFTDEAIPADRVRALVIPEGFAADVVQGEQRKLRLEQEPGTSEQFGMAAQVHVFRAMVRVLGRLVEMDPPADSAPDVAALLEQYRQLATRQPSVRVEVSTAGRGRPVPSGLAQSVPGNMTFIVLMMTLIYGAVFLTIEKQSGMLRRQSSAPLGRTRLFLGKLLGRLLLAGIQMLILTLAGRFLFGLSFGNSPLALALLLASYAIAVGGLSTLLGAVLKTPEQASAVGWITAMVLAAMGGCWWPSEVTPSWMQTIGHAFPTAWAMDGLHALISFGQGIEAIGVPVLVLLGFGTVFSVLGARFLRVEG